MGLNILNNSALYLKSEENLRNILLKTLKKKGITIWDCRGEPGKCFNPIIIDGTPMVNIVGDIPFLYNDRYYVIELKFKKNRCAYITKDKLFGTQRDTLMFDESQLKLILENGGVFVILSEPTPLSLKIPLIRGNSREECEKKLIKAIKIPLAENFFSYEVWILNQKFLQKINEKYLKHKKPKRRNFFNRYIEYKSLPWKELQNIVPESMIKLTLSDIKNGKIGDKIISIL